MKYLIASLKCLTSFRITQHHETENKSDEHTVFAGPTKLITPDAWGQDEGKVTSLHGEWEGTGDAHAHSVYDTTKVNYFLA